MSSCETSDAEGPVPVNSAAVLRKSQPAGGSPCRGHVLRKAKVSSLSRGGDTCPEAGWPPWEGQGRCRVLSPRSPQSQPPSGGLLFKGEEPGTSRQGAYRVASAEAAALGAPGFSLLEWGSSQRVQA